MPRGCVPNPSGPGGNAFDGSRSVLQPSPPRPSGTRPASSAALPASLPCLVTVPPAARLPTLPEAHSFGFTIVYRTARPGERLIQARLRLARPCVPCGSGPHVAGTRGPAGRTLRLGLGLASPVACPDREDSSPALDPLFSPRCPSLSGSPEAPHSGVKGLPEKLVLIVSKCSSVLYGLAAPTSLSPLYRCVCKVFK